jgi:ribosomal protein L40E
VEHTCHRCNATVPANTLFCGQCGAPQIRVATSEEEESARTQAASPASTDVNSPDLPLRTAARVPLSPVLQPKARTPITWSTALPKAAISGFATVVLLVAVLALTKSAFFLLLIIPLGGVLSVWLYARGKDPNEIVTGTGARVGAVTGLFSYLIYGIIVGAQISTQKGLIQDAMRKAIQDAVARNPNPETQAMLNQVMTPEGIATLLTVSAVIFLFVFLIFGALGGSVGAAMLRNTRGDQDRL